MPITIKKIKTILSGQKAVLKERYGVKKMGVFGSYVKGLHRKGSDLDILVDFNRPVSLIKFLELENYLGEVTGVKVDLVMQVSLKPRIGSRIMEEVVEV